MKEQKQVPLPNVQPVPVTTVQEEQEKRYSRKRWLLALVLVFFLFSVIFIIPVGRIPGLAQLARLMGFSAQDTQSMSFGRALLTWAGGADRRVSPEDEMYVNGVSLFDNNSLGGFNANGPKSGLFDVYAVDAMRRRRGLGPEGVAGSVLSNGQEGDSGASTPRGVGELSEEARRAAVAQKQDKYFGEDANVAARAQGQTGPNAGSANTITRIPKLDIIASAGAVDGLGRAIDRASLVGLGDLTKELEEKVGSGTTYLNNLQGSLTAGQKPQRDLGTVWLFSRAAKRPPQPMLKKQLASGGYLAMELPKKAYDSEGENAGVRLVGDEVVGNIAALQKSLFDEEQCRGMSQSVSESYGKFTAGMEEQISVVRNSMPRSCEDVVNWKTALSNVENNCRNMRDQLKGMEKCGVAFENNQTGRCESSSLNTYASDVQTNCDALAAKMAELKALEAMGEETDPEAVERVKEEIEALENNQDFLLNGAGKPTSEDISAVYDMYDKDGNRRNNDFFPAVDPNSIVAGHDFG